MISLLMDTSNQYMAVAIYKDGQCLEKIVEYGSLRQSENAIPALEKLLKNNKLTLFDADEMIITRGPGSYTGVRVAMTIAKTLNVVHPISLKAISSLHAYAGLNKCVSVIDARSKKVFVCAYQDGDPLEEEKMIEIVDFETYMKDYQGFEIVGQSEVVGIEEKKVDLIKNMYDIAQNEKEVDNVDLLVPRYIKDIEVKKICK